jgi:hypothetical protein
MNIKELIASVVTMFWCVITMAAFVYILSLAYDRPIGWQEPVFGVAVLVFSLLNAFVSFQAFKKS